MARPLLPELIKAIRVTSRRVSPYFLARKQTRQPGGQADSRVVVNGEGSNLSPSRTDPPSHASEAVASATTLANMWTDFDLHISTTIVLMTGSLAELVRRCLASLVPALCAAPRPDGVCTAGGTAPSRVGGSRSGRRGMALHRNKDRDPAHRPPVPVGVRNPA